LGLKAPSPDHISFYEERNMEKKVAGAVPLDPFRGAGGKGPAAPLTATIHKRLPALKKRFYFHRPQASCKAMESGTLFFVRPIPPKGGGRYFR